MGAGKLVSFALAACVVSALATFEAIAHESPNPCGGTGVTLMLSSFRADGETRATGEPVNECETLVYRGTLCHPGSGQCAIQGGTLTLVTPDGASHDVTPAGGVPIMGNGECIPTETFTYVGDAGDATGGEFEAKLTYSGGFVHDGPSDTAVADAVVTARNPVDFCSDGDFCNGVEVCDPNVVRGVRKGFCGPGAPCNDGDACNGVEICDAVNEICSPGTPPDCDDGAVCTVDSCDPLAGCVHEAPDCDDACDWTIDSCNTSTGDCVNDPQGSVSAADARAWGATVHAGAIPVVAPTPDSNVASPAELLLVPAAPAAEIEVLGVEESSVADASGATASAEATTGEVRLVDSAGQWLVTATSVTAVVDCVSDATTGGCTSEGSVLEDVVVNGQSLGTVHEPTTIHFVDPLARFVTVRLLEHVAAGASAGVVQPDQGTFDSHLAVNAIHVIVEPSAADPDGPGVPTLDVVVAHAEAGTSFGNPGTCRQLPYVSGHAFVLHGGTSFATVGRVDLPASGGAEDAAILHVGPLTDDPPTMTLAEADAGLAHSEGTVDEANQQASSSSEAAIERVELLDGSVVAEAVRAECTSSADAGGASSTGRTEIVGLEVNGMAVCDELSTGGVCAPPPNTLVLGGPVEIVLNEQICDVGDPPGCADGTGTGLTVHAIRIAVSPDGQSAGRILVSGAHCDAGVP